MSPHFPTRILSRNLASFSFFLWLMVHIPFIVSVPSFSILFKLFAFSAYASLPNCPYHYPLRLFLSLSLHFTHSFTLAHTISINDLTFQCYSLFSTYSIHFLFAALPISLHSIQYTSYFIAHIHIFIILDSLLNHLAIYSFPSTVRIRIPFLSLVF